MTDQSKPDAKEINSSFNQLVRDQRASRRVSWTPSSSLDPEVQRTDRDNLNAALRKAGGHGDPEEGGEPYRWKSLNDVEDGY